MQLQLIKQDFAEADQQSIVQLNLQQVRKQTNKTFSRRQSVLAAFFLCKVGVWSGMARQNPAHLFFFF